MNADENFGRKVRKKSAHRQGPAEFSVYFGPQAYLLQSHIPITCVNCYRFRVGVLEEEGRVGGNL